MKISKGMVLGIIALMILPLAGCGAGKKPEPTAAPVLTPREPPVLAGPKKRVGIFDFENKSRYGQNKLSQAATDVMSSELDKTGRFVLYERANLAELEKEHRLIESGRINPATAARFGELTGIQAVVIGTITQFGIWEEAKDYGVYQKKVEIAEATVDARVVDVTTGRVIFSDAGTGRTERALETVLGFGERATYDETMADKALRAALAQFMGRMVQAVDGVAWEGRVAEVDQVGGVERVYINAGRSSGMQVGRKVAVKQVIGEITDPVTGEFMGYKTRDLGSGAVEELSGEDLSIARMRGSPGVKRGDLVVLAE